MADTALASMTAATTLGGTELIYGTQSSADVKITPNQIKTLAIGAGSVSVASGKTLTASNSITLAGTDATTMTLPAVSASLGYLGVPQNSKSAAYTTVLGDAGTHILHPSADTTARTFTIEATPTWPTRSAPCSPSSTRMPAALSRSRLRPTRCGSRAPAPPAIARWPPTASPPLSRSRARNG